MTNDSAVSTSAPESASARDPTASERTDDAEERIDRLERRVAALESELDAVRGLLGGVEAVDEAVERRASIALAKVEALEREFAAAESGVVRERLAGASDHEVPSTDSTPTGSDGPSPSSADPDGLAERLRGVLE